jgi:hypothetical protein
LVDGIKIGLVITNRVGHIGYEYNLCRGTYGSPYDPLPFNEEFYDYVIKKYSFMTIERIWRNPKGSGGCAPRIKLLVMFSIFVIKNYSFMTQPWTHISILGGAEGRGS